MAFNSPVLSVGLELESSDTALVLRDFYITLTGCGVGWKGGVDSRSVGRVACADEQLVASSSAELLQAEWDGAGPVGGPFDLFPGGMVQ
jgi:hypothetical protein